MELIRATNKDVQELLEIEKTAIGLKVYSGYFSEKEVKEWIEKESVYLIDNNGVIVGSISFEVIDKNKACISGLVIKPEFQRQGFAKKAIVLLFEKLKNFKKLTLTVHPDNHALELYKSLGFTVDSCRENYFGDGEPRLIMIKNT